MLPRTLFGRLLLVFLAFGVVMTAALLAVMQGSHRLYHLESDQTINRGLARGFVDANFLIAESPLTGATLHRGLAKLSAANPEVDIYLLDGTGRVVAASVPEAEWRRHAIALAPIERFLAGDALPILADDPRDAKRREVFSAAPVAIRECPAKYLYIVLDRGQHVAVASRLRTLYALGEGMGVLLLAAVLAVVLSLVVLRLLTQRLSVLENAMRRFQAGDTGVLDPRLLPVVGHAGDEIDRLAELFQQLAARVQAQVRALESTDLMRREILANVSHDLRTPLTTLQMHLETIMMPESTTSPSEQQEYVAIALKQTRRLIALVEQLLEVAKLDARQVVPQIEPFPVGELLHDIAQKFALPASERDVRVIVEAPPNVPWVTADIGLIERVLDNLIENALRHSLPGGHVSLALAPVDDRIRITVADTGPGLAAADHGRIFDRFYRADPGRANNGGNAGLGLAIVKSILELHHAAIRVDSEPGAGARFWFELPVWTAAPGPAQATARGAGADEAVRSPTL